MATTTFPAFRHEQLAGPALCPGFVTGCDGRSLDFQQKPTLTKEKQGSSGKVNLGL